MGVCVCVLRVHLCVCICVCVYVCDITHIYFPLPWFFCSKLSGVGAGGVRVEVDGVLQSVYQLRVHRRFEDADRLEQLLELFLGRELSASD